MPARLSVGSPSLRTVTSPSSPADRVSTPVDGVEVLGALSPSRAAAFLSCPLAYRFRTIDRLPDPASPAMVRGTVVHRVLEELFDLPAARRTPQEAREMVSGVWSAVQGLDPTLAGLFGTDPTSADLAAWLETCRGVLDTYFTLEDPQRLEPAEREVYVETVLDTRLLLRGFVDRVDLAPDGAVRIVDYKTGRAPGVGHEHWALFQMRFYALLWWRRHGVLPTSLKLVYLGSGETISYSPDELDLEATRRKVEAIWAAIQEATRTGQWQPRPGSHCSWCSYRAICPEQGGTPPPLPAQA